MAEDFQAGICRDNWWNFSQRGVLGSGGPACSPAVFDMMGSYGWPADVVDMKPRSTNCIETSLVCHSPISHQDAQKPQQHTDFMDSTLHMMGFGLSPSSALDWNQSFLCNNGNMLQEDMTSKLTDIDSSQIQKDFSSGSEDSAINAFKPLSTDDFIVSSSVTCTATCQGLPPNFPVVSSSPSNVYQSTLLNSLINPEPEPQQSLYNNGLITPNYEMNSNGFSPSWVKTSLPKLQPPELLYNNTHFSNASTTSVNILLPDLLPSAQANFLRSNFEEKSKRNSDHVRDVKKMGSNPNPPLKRPRIGAPSPLPTFKVRKEKLGDRITVLQQLVSPFGKTDTASVLQEAIEYIKFLHDQVNNLSTPYMKNGAPSIHQQQGCEQTKGTEEPKLDLESRGLCLVPLSSTFPIASETTADFWTPTFGGPFR